MIVIYDKGGGKFIKAALAAAKEVFGEENVVQGFANPDQLPEAFSMDEDNYVVAHLSESQWSLLSENWPMQVRSLIRVSSQGAGGMPSYAPPKEVRKGAWILHATHGGGEISAEDWIEIFSSINEWKNLPQGAPPHRLVDTLYKDYEPLLAFRLLCAAKKECGEGFIKENALGTDLAIYAPDGLEGWLRPFEESDIERAAKLIGVGRYTNQVLAVLEAAEKEWSELAKAITEFEAEYERQQNPVR